MKETEEGRPETGDGIAREWQHIDRKSILQKKWYYNECSG
jgi:hypothetical protein